MIRSNNNLHCVFEKMLTECMSQEQKLDGRFFALKRKTVHNNHDEGPRVKNCNYGTAKAENVWKNGRKRERETSQETK